MHWKSSRVCTSRGNKGVQDARIWVMSYWLCLYIVTYTTNSLPSLHNISFSINLHIFIHYHRKPFLHVPWGGSYARSRRSWLHDPKKKRPVVPFSRYVVLKKHFLLKRMSPFAVSLVDILYLFYTQTATLYTNYTVKPPRKKTEILWQLGHCKNSVKKCFFLC